MLLEITTTYEPATDLGYLLHKNPARPQSFTLSFGKAHVFYPEASAGRCTAALLLDVDPVGLVRGRQGSSGQDQGLQQYVNDRPYVASSFMSVAIAEIYGSALNGRSKDRPELADTPLPLEARVAVVPARGGEGLLRRLWEPLGYEVALQGYVLDQQFPDWGQSPYWTLNLRATIRLRDLLTHLYLLIPVLDDDKHYYVGDEEVEKLLRHGAGWLAAHPERELITNRYLRHRRTLARDALARLVDADNVDPDATEEAHAQEEAKVEAPLQLHEQRLNAVAAALKAAGAQRVLDLGCGEGRLIKVLLQDKSFVEIVGMDVSHRILEVAQDRLHLDRLAPQQRERVRLFQGSLIYRDKRLSGYDAAAVVEVIEHLDAPRLAAFERVVWEFARPTTIVVTTPNQEYNSQWPSLPAGKFRHKDHRFEWTRAEFQTWATGVAERWGYGVSFHAIGPEDQIVGAPTQMGVFERG